MSRFIDPIPSYTLQGDIVTNGLMYFLEPNTTGFNSSDFKDTWSDVGFTSLNTNPVQLNGDGQVPDIYLQGNYRVALYTSGGVDNGQQVFDIPNYEGSPLSEQFGDWSGTTNYQLDDYVQASDGAIYKSLQANNLNHNPIDSGSWWSKIAFIGFYNANETYAVDDVVLYQGILYTSLVASNTGNTPSTSTSQWQSFTGSVNANTVSYDNTSSGLSASDAQAAIDELNTDKQPLDSDLTAIAALTTTSFGRSVLGAADAAGLLALGGVTASAAELNYSTNVTSDIQSQLNARLQSSNNLSDLPNAATARANLGAEIGLNVQAYSANLDVLSGYTVLDEDDMVSDSDSGLTTQQAAKAYVDAAVAAGVTAEVVEDFVGAMVTGNTETLITVTYEDSDGTLDFVVDNDLSNYDNSTSGFLSSVNNANWSGTDLTVQNGGTGASNATDARTNLGVTSEFVQDIAGGMVTGNTETLITVTYQDADGTIDFVVDNDLSNYDNSSSAFLTSVNNSNWSGAGLSVANGGTGVSDLSSLQLEDFAVTVSTSAPSGGSDGDVWFQREA